MDQTLIVGAGPTGLTMAVELSRQGVPYRLIEKSPMPSQWSQALVVQARTLEQFERYGIADHAVSQGRRLGHAEMVSEGRTIVSFPLNRIPGRYPFALFLPQSQTERLLTDHLQSLGGQIERGTELLSFTNTPDGVQATLLRGDGRTETTPFRWIIGCDGAHSAVRHGLSVPFEGDTVGLSFLLGDLELQGPNVPGDELRIYLHRGDVVFFGRLTERIWRVILVEHGRNWEQTNPSPEVFQQMIDRIVGPGVQVTGSHWISPYRVNQRKARHYRIASAFLAGDACHIHSPVAGQGMNTGIQDAANLGWKLGAVYRGAPDALLDTYDAERGAVGDDLLRRTSRGLALATTSNPVAELARDVAAKVATSVPYIQDLLVGFISETSIRYDPSAIAVDRGGDGQVTAGERVPNPDTPGGRLLDPLKDGKSLALTTDAAGVEHPRLTQRILDPSTMSPDISRVIGMNSGQILIVRPDGYLGFRGAIRHTADLETYAQFTGIG